MANSSTESVIQILNIVPILYSLVNKKYLIGTIAKASISAHLEYALISNVDVHRHQIARFPQTKIA